MCLQCFDILNENNFEIKVENIKKGMMTVVHKARFETLKIEPKIIFDGAHNDSAIKNFRETVNMYYKQDVKIYIISLLKTKDINGFLKEILQEKNAKFIFTSGIDERFYTKEELYESAINIINENNEVLEENMLQKLELIDSINMCKKNLNKVIFFVGSFYIYKTVIEGLNS